MTAYEMRISDWSSDVCSSDLIVVQHLELLRERQLEDANLQLGLLLTAACQQGGDAGLRQAVADGDAQMALVALCRRLGALDCLLHGGHHAPAFAEEHLAGPRPPRQPCTAVAHLHPKLAFHDAHRTRTNPTTRRT